MLFYLILAIGQFILTIALQNQGMQGLLHGINIFLLLLVILVIVGGKQFRALENKINMLDSKVRWVLLPVTVILLPVIYIGVLILWYHGSSMITEPDSVDHILIIINGFFMGSWLAIVAGTVMAPSHRALVCKVLGIITVILAYASDKLYSEYLFHGKHWIAMIFPFLTALWVHYKFFKLGGSGELERQNPSSIPPASVKDEI